MMLEDRLETMGYGVLRATNGVEALDVLGMIPIVGVLLDIEMPVMDGLTLLREMQHRHMNVPVIVMSAGSDSQKFVQAVELGAMDYLKKPIDTLILAQKCARLFE
jgi:DNA-binding response OmpR family regulator